jgi:predicted deacylase
MSAAGYFARDYADARRKFLAAATTAGLTVTSYENLAKGPAGEALFTDVVRIGSPTARRIVLVNSATHGVEGFCGSGIIVGWLRSGQWKRLPRGVAMVLVHAINPHGFAWLRRVTEDNVDLNRNFQDFSKPLPSSAAYDELHPAILPERWDDGVAAEQNKVFRAYRERHGAMALQGAISGGQYRHADGVFYGGTKPTWPNRTFHAILAKFVAKARHVAFIDLHTGLGPYGYGELICHAVPDTAEWTELQAWYGEGLTSPDAGNSSSAKLTGFIRKAVVDALPAARVRALTIEYGTFAVPVVLGALIADNWLHLKGRLGSKQGLEIKAEIRRAFFPDEDDWKEMVALRGHQIMRRAARGVAAA